MKKTDKKIENTIRISLTEVCESLKGEVFGFEWLSHKVDFSNVNHSLQVTFMFATNESLRKAKLQLQTDKMANLACSALAKHNIHINNAAKQCCFETEERSR
ncbi:Fis family transcriptional regulator [Shewanella sp. Choline-02u-19]|uniref:Fis family transcriptional regulator n=1 Tax=unclassified Shewanella TaxID=196818 RepID=UPI000C33A639|nr:MULTISPECIES: Fis family transcriptional regulator [unclassified Shewanella]PKH57049.1 Fis family transcriptional regulator [Shewanella sp. Bg11-22]PKI27846.1 Fis family transcriptional regulator [Shewanella sp. Choline-02u-19]